MVGGLLRTGKGPYDTWLTSVSLGELVPTAMGIINFTKEELLPLPHVRTRFQHLHICTRLLAVKNTLPFPHSLPSVPQTWRQAGIQCPSILDGSSPWPLRPGGDFLCGIFLSSPVVSSDSDSDSDLSTCSLEDRQVPTGVGDLKGNKETGE